MCCVMPGIALQYHYGHPREVNQGNLWQRYSTLARPGLVKPNFNEILVLERKNQQSGTSLTSHPRQWSNGLMQRNINFSKTCLQFLVNCINKLCDKLSMLNGNNFIFCQKISLSSQSNFNQFWHGFSRFIFYVSKNHVFDRKKNATGELGLNYVKCTLRTLFHD